MIKGIFILLLLIMPCTAFAECRLTESLGKLEGVCWGDNPMSPPKAKSKKHAKIDKSGVALEEVESEMQAVVMTEEESKFMHARNRMDGYRGKPIGSNQIAKK